MERVEVEAIIIIAFSVSLLLIMTPGLMKWYDDNCDETWGNPNWMGPDVSSPTYAGGYWTFHVDKLWPSSELIVIANSTSANQTYAIPLQITDWRSSVGGTEYWVVEKRFGPDRYEYVNYFGKWWIFNTTSKQPMCMWTGRLWDIAWPYASADGLFCNDFNLTLYASWHGWI